MLKSSRKEMNWDSIARKYVEYDTAHMDTFAPLVDVDPHGLFLAAQRETQGQYHKGGIAGSYGDEPASIITVDYVLSRKRYERLQEYVKKLANDNPAPAGIRRDWNGNVSVVFSDGTERRGEFMQTFTGLKFWPLDPHEDEVDIRDIAHSLAMQCRYGGHSKRFYSVAEHSVLMARSVSPENALWALLHDAAEAYLADVPSPLKRHLPGYKEAETRVMRAVCTHYGLPYDMPAEVHEADARILADEISQNMAPMDWHARHNNPLGIRLQFWPPETAEIYFLDTFRRLTRGEELRRVG